MAFIIDGTEYDIPTFDSFTIGESRIIKRYTGAVPATMDDLDSTDPDMTAAMIHIAFQRENPAMSFAALERLVDAVKWTAIDFTEEAEEEAVDPPTQSTPAESPDAAPPSSGESGTDNGAPTPESVSQLASGVPASDTTLAFVPPTSVT